MIPDMTQLIFVYIIPSAFAISLMALIIGWILMPPTAKILLLKKMGLARGSKGYVMVAYDDRIIQTEAMNVYTEGAMEKKKKWGSLTFYLAKPQEDTANTTDNLKNEERDRDVLPPYFLDGVLPVFFGHVSKAIATNPKTLTALRFANRANSKEIEADALFPESVEVLKPHEVTNEYEEKTTMYQKIKTFAVKVILPFDPVDIKKNFSLYWQQAVIDATKKRHQAIGAEKEKRSGNDIIKMLLIVGAVVSIGIIVSGIVSGLFKG